MRSTVFWYTKHRANNNIYDTAHTYIINIRSYLPYSVNTQSDGCQSKPYHLDSYATIIQLRYLIAVNMFYQKFGCAGSPTRRIGMSIYQTKSTLISYTTLFI